MEMSHLYAWLDGFVMIAEGLVRVVTLGRFCTQWRYRYLVWSADRRG